MNTTKERVEISSVEMADILEVRHENVLATLESVFTSKNMFSMRRTINEGYLYLLPRSVFSQVLMTSFDKREQNLLTCAWYQPVKEEPVEVTIEKTYDMEALIAIANNLLNSGV